MKNVMSSVSTIIVLTTLNWCDSVHGETTPIRINSGAAADVIIDGVAWEADRNWIASTDRIESTTATIDLNNELNQIQRTFWWPGFYYEFYLDSPGTYTINLYFSENKYNGINNRVFDILINDIEVERKFDIFKESGGKYKQIIKSYTVDITILDLDYTTGLYLYKLHIEKMQGSLNWPVLSALELLGDPTNEPLNSININCGHGAFGDSSNYYLDIDSDVWLNDESFLTVNDPTYVFEDISGDYIINTPNDGIYQTERWTCCGNDLSYTIPYELINIMSGPYTIKLYFAETFFTQSGQRVFDIMIQNQLVTDNLDIYDEVGHDTPLVIEYGPYVFSENEDLIIELISDIENPKLCGITIGTYGESSSLTPPTLGPYVFTGINTWSSLASLPISIGELTAASIDTTGYYVWGGQSTSGDYNYNMFKYIISDDRWFEVGNIPLFATGDHQTAQVYNGKIYTFGGSNPDYGFYMKLYDPVTDNWSLLAGLSINNINYDLLSASSGLYNDNIYVVGGIYNQDTVSMLFVYNIINNEWTQIEDSSMPDNGRNHAAGIFYNNLFYIFGGRQGDNIPDFGYIDSFVYDPSDMDTTVTTEYNRGWRNSGDISDMLVGIGGGGKAIEMNDKLIVMGGETCCDTIGYVEEYDPSINEWNYLTNMITPRHGISPVAIGNKIYVVGGGIVSGFSQSDVHEVLTFE